MNDRDRLIGSLTHDLQPVRPVMAADWMAVVWVLGSLLYVIAVAALWGPIRVNAIHQLLTVPRFLLESLTGLAAIALVACCAFRAAIPGRLQPSLPLAGLTLLALWLLQYVIGLWLPALEPSMAGKRDLCWLQTGLFAVPPILVAFLTTKRLYPLRPWQTALGVSLAAGMLPALYMQLACVYIVPHILVYHLLPGLLVALAGTALALLYRR